MHGYPTHLQWDVIKSSHNSERKMISQITLKLASKQRATVWWNIPHCVPLQQEKVVFFYYAKIQNPFFQGWDHFLSASLQNGSFVRLFDQQALASLRFLGKWRESKAHKQVFHCIKHFTTVKFTTPFLTFRLLDYLKLVYQHIIKQLFIQLI